MWKYLTKIKAPGQLSDIRTYKRACSHLYRVRSLELNGMIHASSPELKMMTNVANQLTELNVNRCSEGQNLFAHADPLKLEILRFTTLSKNKVTWADLCSRSPWPRLRVLKLDNINGSIKDLMEALAAKPPPLEFLSITRKERCTRMWRDADFIFKCTRACSATLKRFRSDLYYKGLTIVTLRPLVPDMTDFQDFNVGLKERTGVGLDVVRVDDGRFSFWRHLAEFRSSFDNLQEVHDLCWPKERYEDFGSIRDLRVLSAKDTLLRVARLRVQALDLLKSKLNDAIAQGQLTKSMIKTLDSYFSAWKNRTQLEEILLQDPNPLQLGKLAFNGFAEFVREASDDLLVFAFKAFDSAMLLQQRCGCRSFLSFLMIARDPNDIPRSLVYAFQLITESPEAWGTMKDHREIEFFVWRRAAPANDALQKTIFEICWQDSELWRQFVGSTIQYAPRFASALDQVLEMMPLVAHQPDDHPVQPPSQAFSLPLWMALLERCIAEKYLKATALAILQRVPEIPEKLQKFLDGNDEAMPTALGANVVRKELCKYVFKTADK
eukprot:TRINITY_DN136_c0_g1_i1.p1 TRINITY_DN136_c0_g1~~TRINITY_DN136_c0_g1_i1.p1  ORF type:complete len:551 (+),score=96.09 TRINITY_DN136_c0_g1_i1:587-2239(+)